ncbi:MAG: hypothetical protein ACREHF_00010 [Rhizomicrobium sp.]
MDKSERTSRRTEALARLRRHRFAALFAPVAFGCAPCLARTDEIQVYDAEIAPGVFNLTLHDNYTPSDRSLLNFPGGIVPNQTLNGVPEWAYGVTDRFEAGLYLPPIESGSHFRVLANTAVYKKAMLQFASCNLTAQPVGRLLAKESGG